jgi:carbamoyl-phosphate synthase large subunit
VLVTRAGSGATGNLVAGLRAGLRDVFVAGCNDEPFPLKKSTADASYLVPPPSHPRYAASLSAVIEREAIDLVLPVSDADVSAISALRRRIGARVWLPHPRTLELCADKLRLATRLRSRNVPVPASFPVRDLARLDAVFARIPGGGPAWCRARRGAGSLAAAPVPDPARARGWIELWSQVRGVDARAFMLAEYLPGRDFAAQSLWRAGRLVLIKTTERLAYVDGAARLSGTSSVASIHKTVRDERLVDVVRRAVLAVDRTATGAFSVDLKEDAEGRPRVTEINAGRFLSGTTIFDEVGRYNMSATYVRLGTGRYTGGGDIYDAVSGHYVVRDLDTPPRVFGTDEFWTGWMDARALGDRQDRDEGGGRHGRTTTG